SGNRRRFHLNGTAHTTYAFLRGTGSRAGVARALVPTRDRDASASPQTRLRLCVPPADFLDLGCLALRELQHCGTNILDLFLRDCWEHRKRQDAFGKRFAYREVVSLVSKAGVCLLQVERNRIVQASFDSLCVKVLFETFAIV